MRLPAANVTPKVTAKIIANEDDFRAVETLRNYGQAIPAEQPLDPAFAKQVVAITWRKFFQIRNLESTLHSPYSAALKYQSKILKIWPQLDEVIYGNNGSNSRRLAILNSVEAQVDQLLKIAPEHEAMRTIARKFKQINLNTLSVNLLPREHQLNKAVNASLRRLIATEQYFATGGHLEAFKSMFVEIKRPISYVNRDGTKAATSISELSLSATRFFLLTLRDAIGMAILNNQNVVVPANWIGAGATAKLVEPMLPLIRQPFDELITSHTRSQAENILHFMLPKNQKAPVVTPRTLEFLVENVSRASQTDPLPNDQELGEIFHSGRSREVADVVNIAIQFPEMIPYYHRLAPQGLTHRGWCFLSLSEGVAPRTDAHEVDIPLPECKTTKEFLRKLVDVDPLNAIWICNLAMVHPFEEEDVLKLAKLSFGKKIAESTWKEIEKTGLIPGFLEEKLPAAPHTVVQKPEFAAAKSELRIPDSLANFSKLRVKYAEDANIRVIVRRLNAAQLLSPDRLQQTFCGIEHAIETQTNALLVLGKHSVMTSNFAELISMGANPEELISELQHISSGNANNFSAVLDWMLALREQLEDVELQHQVYSEKVIRRGARFDNLRVFTSFPDSLATLQAKDERIKIYPLPSASLPHFGSNDLVVLVARRTPHEYTAPIKDHAHGSGATLKVVTFSGASRIEQLIQGLETARI